MAPPGGGVIDTLAINPQNPATLYAASSDGGGLFKSTDGGNSWGAANSSLPLTHVLASAIDPESSMTVYAGTNGGGVFKSTDSGNSWAAINCGLANPSVWAVGINPQSPSTIYAGTYGGGVFKLVSRQSWDADVDGKEDIAVWRPDAGTWYSLLSASPGSYTSEQFYLPTDDPVPGDYDGDGKSDLAVWRQSEGVWYILCSNIPGTYTDTQCGSLRISRYKAIMRRRQG